MFEAGEPDEVQRIEPLMGEAGGACLDLGGFFSRPYGPMAEAVYEKCPDTARALRKVKAIFDPRGIMNPGRLCFGKEA